MSQILSEEQLVNWLPRLMTPYFDHELDELVTKLSTKFTHTLSDKEQSDLRSSLSGYLRSSGTARTIARAWRTMHPETEEPTRFSCRSWKLMKPSDQPEKLSLFENTTAKGHETLRARFRLATEDKDQQMMMFVKMARINDEWTFHTEEEGGFLKPE